MNTDSLSELFIYIDNLKALTFQEKFILKESASDLMLWGGPQFRDLWPKDYKVSNKVEAKKIFNCFMEKINKIRNTPIDYSTFNPPEFNSCSSGFSNSDSCGSDFSAPGKNDPERNGFGKNKKQIELIKAPEKIMGRCPCPDESQTLLCCNLKTMDVIFQCSFACSYCSIKNFYSNTKISVISDLNEKLESFKTEDEIWHIGTGQSSDSLLLGDKYDTITALNNFAKKHKEIIIELKTKTCRTDWITCLQNSVAKNLICTWSLNAQTVAQKEEHLASSVPERIKAAQKCSEQGIGVGFHIHPIIRFSGWEKEYSALVKMLVDKIDPKKTIMISLGTLTFTKQALKTIRNNGLPTRVTQIPLTLTAGKYSYPFEMKKELFSALYGFFPQDWKDNVFFYLCMEDKRLWQPCLGRSYLSNKEFEQDMKKNYFEKINAQRR